MDSQCIAESGMATLSFTAQCLNKTLANCDHCCNKYQYDSVMYMKTNLKQQTTSQDSCKIVL